MQTFLSRSSLRMLSLPLHSVCHLPKNLQALANIFLTQKAEMKFGEREHKEYSIEGVGEVYTFITTVKKENF